jgi:hypothetical protein
MRSADVRFVMEDNYMERVVQLSDIRQRYEDDVRTEALIVGGVSPSNLIRGQLLRACELVLIAEMREIRHKRGDTAGF